jgi:hypothetical protein
MRLIYLLTAACALVALLVGVAGAVTCDCSLVVIRHTRCFPKQIWNAPPGLRPCVTPTRIYEDGSFKYSVSDANGTVRYSGGVGTEDR